MPNCFSMSLSNTAAKGAACVFVYLVVGCRAMKPLLDVVGSSKSRCSCDSSELERVGI